MVDIAKNLYEKIFFLDDNKIGSSVCDIPVIGNSMYAVEHKNEYDVFVAIGDSEIREKMIAYYQNNGVKIPTLIHQNAVVADDVEIGLGTVIMAGAVINSSVKIGKGCIVNTGASVDHDNIIQDYAHISVGSHLAGNVQIGEKTWIGAGAVVSNNIAVCKDCTVGAGAVVVKNICEQGIYVGVPAKKIVREKDGMKISLAR